MSVSSWFSTSNEYIKYRIEVTVNSQDQANNYSNVTVKVYVYRTNTGYETYGSGKCYCTIDGTQYSQSITTSQKITNSGIYLFSKTLNVTHDNDGSKVLDVSAWIDHSRFDSSTNYYTPALATIPRASAFSVKSGALGEELTISIVKADADFTHTIRYSCGTLSGVIATQTSESMLKWIPPLSLAAQNTSGYSVAITLSCISFNGNTQLGTTSEVVSLTIPQNCAPTCTLDVSDAEGYSDIYGAYVQGKSRLSVKIVPELSYGSPIQSYSVTVDGVSYPNQSVETDVLTTSGEVTIKATVRDGRGAVGQAEATITVLPYVIPLVPELSATRCNADGSDNFEGEYCRIDFKAEVTPLGNKNSANYRIEYKQTSASNYTSITLNDYAGNYTPEGSCVIAMSSTKTYDVTLYAIDDFNATPKHITASTAFALIVYGSDGKSIAFGKTVDWTNAADFGLKVRLSGGIMAIELDGDENLDFITTTGFYIGQASSGQTNNPISSGHFMLHVYEIGTAGQLVQEITTCDPEKRNFLWRIYQDNSWRDWVDEGSAEDGHTHDLGGEDITGVLPPSKLVDSDDDAIAIVNVLKSALVDMLYPVGAIYISADATSPEGLFGGMWEQIQDRFILASGSEYQAGESGGAASYDLSVSHKHVAPIGYNSEAVGSININGTVSTGSGKAYRTASTDYSGSSLSSNVTGLYTGNATVSANIPTIPPYLAVYVWKRIA